MYRLKININASTPVYQQISTYIYKLIRQGHLTAGERLPPERELALRLNVARGTVKKAYDLLVQQKMVVAKRGHGSVVVGCSDGESEKMSRVDKAQKKIISLINELEVLDIGYREMGELFSACLFKREEEVAAFTIAAVDCNPEALGIFRKQIAMLTRMSMAQFLLEEVRNEVDPEAMLQPFSLILTTTNHIGELKSLVPALAERCVPVIVQPSSATLVALAKIAADQRLGVIYQSKRFFEIIRIWLKKSEVVAVPAGLCVEGADAAAFADFLKGREVVILPPGFAAQFPTHAIMELNRFRQNGGTLLDFAYEIDRGSLLHLDSLIRNLLNEARKST